MNKALVIGSCRVYYPCQGIKNVLQYPGGLVHTPRQILQSIRAMDKVFYVDKENLKNVFYINKGITINSINNVNIDLDKYDRFIIEISSLTDYYTKDFICHSFKDCIDVPYTICKYTLETLLDYLDKIHIGLRHKSVLFINHSTKFTLDKYMLSYALSIFQGCNVAFFDTMKFISKYGMQKTLKDQDHYTTFMISEIQSEILKFIS